MQCLSVTKDIDGESGIVPLHGRDILFLEWSGKLDRVVIHTLDSHYYTMGTMKYISTALNNSGYNFEIVDRNNSVNVDRIVRLDPILRTAYFEDEVRRGSKRCTMAIKRYNNLQEKFVSYNPRIILS